jgi:tetratricopeptide (TPR) repeat protein
MKRFTSRIGLLLILFSVIATAAHTAAAKDTWTSVRSKNFFLIGNANEKDVKQVAVKLEQFRDVFSRIFPRMKFSSPVPTTVVVFKSDSSYRPFKISATTAGYFQPGPDVNYITLTSEVRGEQDPFDIIFHEYTHLLVENTLEDAPTWFNEGLAEYYSTFKISNDQKVELGTPIANHVFLLRQNKLLPLRTLFQVDHKSPYYNENNKKSIFYAQSWALMHYLMLNKNSERPAQVAQFVNLTNNKVPLEQAFKQAFQTTFEAMEKELRDYVRQDRYRVMQGHFERKLETDVGLETATLTEAEAQAYLGDLLLHSNRADSEGYLLKALQLDPNLPMAHASLGMLRFRQGKTDEARKSLERAVAANTQNYLIHYYYAFTLSRSRPDDTAAETGYAPGTAAKIREQLNKAIALRPDYPESYNLLAFVNLVTGNDLDQTIELLKKQIQLLPGRGDSKYMLAQLYLRKDDYASGRQLLDQLARSNSEPELAQRAQQLLLEVSRIEEQRERFKAQKTARPTGSPQTFTGTIEVTTPAEPADPQDPSSYLREVLRPPAKGETQLQATLVRVDCEAKGPVFVVQTQQGLLRLRAESFEQIEITTYSPDVKGDLGCGLRRPANVVVVCYVSAPDKRSKVDGILKSIEFVPKDFQLKPPAKP